MAWDDEFDIEGTDDPEWDTASLPDDLKSGTKPAVTSIETVVTSNKRQEAKSTTADVSEKEDDSKKVDDSKQEDAVVEPVSVSAVSERSARTTSSGS